jgi:hypothetical protein
VGIEPVDEVVTIELTLGGMAAMHFFHAIAVCLDEPSIV